MSSPGEAALLGPTGNVVFGALVGRGSEQGAGAVHFDQPAAIEERRGVGDPAGLLQRVRHEGDRVAGFQVVDQVVEAVGRGRVERFARFVDQHDIRLQGQRAGDAEALLLTGRQRRSFVVEPVAAVEPEVGLLQGLLDESAEFAEMALAGDARAEGDVFENAGRERRGFLRYEADPLADVAKVGARGVEIAADLGSGAIATTDLWGRTAKVSLSSRGHVFRIGREPVFIEGIDASLCQLRRGFRVEPGFALSRRAPQEAALVLVNPWPTTINGSLTITGPEKLEISPRTHSFSVPAGGEVRLPITFSVPRGFPAGITPLTASVQGTATEPFRAVLEAPLQLGNDSVKVEPEWRLARSIESGSVDIVLTLRVTNIGKQPIDVEAFAVADGYTQSRKPISSLAPGASAVRVFHFASGAQRLSGRDIRAGVHDPALDARHLMRVAIPPLLPPSRSATSTVNAPVGAAVQAEEDW